MQCDDGDESAGGAEVGGGGCQSETVPLLMRDGMMKGSGTCKWWEICNGGNHNRHHPSSDEMTWQDGVMDFPVNILNCFIVIPGFRIGHATECQIPRHNKALP